MKGVTGIRALAINDVIANLAFVFSMLGVLFLSHSFSTRDLLEFLAIIVSPVSLSLGYPVQLLRIRKKYYAFTPISKRARVFLHIFRIIHLVITVLITLLLVATVYNLFNRWKRFGTPWRDSNDIVSLVAFAVVVLNTILFFKGWRLLKMVRTNYIDHVMETFD